jgi:hypothetical protein
MPENWTAIAAEIAGAIADIGFTATLHEPIPGVGSTDYDIAEDFEDITEITVIDDRIRLRDATGTVTMTARVLTVAATGVVPEKGWHVTVRDKKHRIAEVMPLAPGGVDLLFDLELEG